MPKVFLFIAIVLKIAAFRIISLPAILWRAHTPALSGFRSGINVGGVAYGSLSFDVINSNRSLRFFLGGNSLASTSLPSKDLNLLRYGRDADCNVGCVNGLKGSVIGSDLNGNCDTRIAVNLVAIGVSGLDLDLTSRASIACEFSHWYSHQ